MTGQATEMELPVGGTDMLETGLSGKKRDKLWWDMNPQLDTHEICVSFVIIIVLQRNRI
jgi:hypothetical protein